MEKVVAGKKMSTKEAEQLTYELRLTTEFEPLSVPMKQRKNVDCFKCENKGFVRCGNCHGGNSKCTHCNGHGRRTGPMGHGRVNADVPCAHCRETGFARCEACQGKAVTKCYHEYGEDYDEDDSSTTSERDCNLVSIWVNKRNVPTDSFKCVKGCRIRKRKQLPKRIRKLLHRNAKRFANVSKDRFPSRQIRCQTYEIIVYPTEAVRLMWLRT